MKITKISLLLFSILLILAINAFSFNATNNQLRIVPASEVCMSNNTYFARSQILVEVDGKNYYACCENCKKSLSKNFSSRMAIDPVSDNTVDKALAIIGAKANNKVLYFESIENLNIYNNG